MAKRVKPDRRGAGGRALLGLRATVILVVSVLAGLVVGGLVRAAGHPIAEAVVAGLGAAGATAVACHSLIDPE